MFSRSIIYTETGRLMKIATYNMSTGKYIKPQDTSLTKLNMNNQIVSGVILALLMILMAHDELFNYRNLIALIGFSALFFTSISKLNSSVETFYLPMIGFFLFSLVLVTISFELQEILGAAFSLLLLLVLIMRRDLHVVLFWFLVSINIINVVGWALSVMALIFPDFGSVLTSSSVINYDTVINLFGYQFYRYTGFLWQSSLIASYVILPAILQILISDSNKKNKVIPYANILLSLISISGGYVTLILLAVALYLFVGFFKKNYLLYFIVVITSSLIVIFSNNFLEGVQIDNDSIGYINDRIDSARYRILIIDNQLQRFIEQGNALGVSYDSTGFFGNHFLSYLNYMGYIGLAYSIWLAFSLSYSLRLIGCSSRSSSRFIYALLLAYFVQMFVYYDFGFLGYFGIVLALVVFNFVKIYKFSKCQYFGEYEKI